MRRSGLEALASAVLVLGSQAALAGTLSIKGSSQAHGKGVHQYTLELAYDETTLDPSVEGILVFAEPSHTLLLAHTLGELSSSSAKLIDALAPQAKTSVFVKGQTLFRAKFPYDMDDDIGYSLTFLSNGSQQTIIALGRVNLAEFGTSIDLPAGNGLAENRGTQICCECSSGCKTCLLCDGPPWIFTCTCPGCNLECQ